MEWSQIECEAIVVDYLAMLAKELKGEQYKKSSHRRELQSKLNNRSDGSIEYKHQNISAILIEIGYPYISGYKPAFNYQKLLKQTVESHLMGSKIEHVSDNLIESDIVIPNEIAWDDVLTDAPIFEQSTGDNFIREFTPKHYNYTNRERQNKKIGSSGEEFVLQYEKQRLISAGRTDLVNDLEWTSKEKGDGAGYDIRSFNIDTDAELFIEVKTTKLGKYLPFYISDNEVEFSKAYSEQYSLYRVYDFRNTPKLFTLSGDITTKVNLKPSTYRAGFR